MSRVLCQLGDDVVATGLLGGHMGAYMGSLMDADGIKHDFTPIAGETRICLNILHEGNQTELLESGPEISADELAAFSAKFAELVAKADCVTISGSLPKGVPADFYAGMVAEAAKHDVPVLLDTSGASLDAALEAEVKPTLVKPNLTEINALLGTSATRPSRSPTWPPHSRPTTASPAFRGSSCPWAPPAPSPSTATRSTVPSPRRFRP